MLTWFYGKVTEHPKNQFSAAGKHEQKFKSKADLFRFFFLE